MRRVFNRAKYDASKQEAWREVVKAMRKVDKARLFGYNLAEPQICLLYYVWAKNDSTSYCRLEDSGVCYARPYYLAQRFNLEAEEYLEANPNDNTFIRLSGKGRNLILQLGM